MPLVEQQLGHQLTSFGTQRREAGSSGSRTGKDVRSTTNETASAFAACSLVPGSGTACFGAYTYAYYGSGIMNSTATRRSAFSATLAAFVSACTSSASSMLLAAFAAEGQDFH